jgi:cytochrome c
MRLGGWLLALALLSACGMRAERLTPEEASALTAGDARRGPAAIRRYGCDACHTIPGIPGAHRQVGPELGGVSERMYLGGVLPNSPGNLIRWIRDPRGADSATAMPNLGVSDQDARDIAAYLYSLR